MQFSRPESWSGLPFPSPGDLPNPEIEPGSPALQADTLPSEPSGKPHWYMTKPQKKKKISYSNMNDDNKSNCCCCLVANLCPALCKPVDCSQPGSSIHGIFQARILEWVSISFSRGSS